MAHWDRIVAQLSIPPTSGYVNNPSCGCNHLPKPALVIRVPHSIAALLARFHIPVLR